jgi:phosphonate metabolism-associated iron-containing alcohol dehydrogenase
VTGTPWTFSSPVEIRFGDGQLDSLPSVVRAKRVLVVTSAGSTRRGLTGRVRALLPDCDVETWDAVQPNPALDDIEAATVSAARHEPECIVAVGGGSALDTGKCLSLLIPAHRAGFSLRAHFDGKERLPDVSVIPVVAVPTTAGSGSEVTPFATVWDTAGRRKQSLATRLLLPRTALLDPELTLSLPEDVTVTTGLDALSHAFESIWNRNATPLATACATRAIRTTLEVLPRLRADLAHAGYRSRMLEASLLAGLAISSTRTALAHSISYPVTLHHGVPHGLACSFTLPALLAFNAEADVSRMRELAVSVGRDSVDELRDELGELLRGLDVGKRLRLCVKSLDELLALVPEMGDPARAGNNIRAAGAAEVAAIVTRAWNEL